VSTHLLRRTRDGRHVGFAASPVLSAVKLPPWRSKLVLFAISAAFLALLLRAFYLQIWTEDFLQAQGAARYERVLEMPARRGKITDRNGVVVASSVPVRAIWAIPEDVTASAQELRQLAKLLNLPEKELHQRLSNEDRKFVYLKRQLELGTAERVMALKLKGIHQRTEFKRYYPEGETFAHLLGFTNIEERGQEGVELALEPSLAGKPGSRRVIKDRLGNVIEEAELLRPPLDGRDVILSIDSKIQNAAYTALKEAMSLHKAKAAAAIVVDSYSGEVLALANLPSYNPNDRARLTGAQLRNRVMTDAFEPGSTMKPFIAAMALQAGKVRPETSFNTAPGKMTIGDRTIGDAHPHGVLTVSQIIQKSSNVGTVMLAQKFEPREMWDFFTILGFGQRPSMTQVNFPGATPGRLRPHDKWRPIEQATMSYGHGISVSLAQMARAYTLFARDGDLIPLTLSRLDQPPAGLRVLSAETARAMRAMLESATGPQGTAPKAQVVGYRVAGKTGTAWKQEGGMYLPGKYISSFVGFAPASNPRFVIAVMVDEPSAGHYYAGEVAAPVFSAIAGASLRLSNITPDAPFRPTIIPAEPVLESM
jgi:cell division protein FtsI (penicillin-binding protein 3)